MNNKFSITLLAACTMSAGIGMDNNQSNNINPGQGFSKFSINFITGNHYEQNNINNNIHTKSQNKNQILDLTDDDNSLTVSEMILPSSYEKKLKEKDYKILSLTMDNNDLIEENNNLQKKVSDLLDQVNKLQDLLQDLQNSSHKLHKDFSNNENSHSSRKRKLGTENLEKAIDSKDSTDKNTVCGVTKSQFRVMCFMANIPLEERNVDSVKKKRGILKNMSIDEKIQNLTNSIKKDKVHIVQNLAALNTIKTLQSTEFDDYEAYVKKFTELHRVNIENLRKENDITNVKKCKEFAESALCKFFSYSGVGRSKFVKIKIIN